MKIFIGVFIAFVYFGFVSVSNADWNGIDPGIDTNDSVAVEYNGNTPVPISEWNEDVKLWLARSCVGESGFGADDECIGIAWTYATRYKIINGSVSFVNLIRQYSAALKTRSNTKRPWILGLNLEAKTPNGWPSNLDWDNIHSKLWTRLLEKLDAWASGKIANPVSGADHFGGPMDHNIYNWKRIMPNSKLVFRNRFYRSTSVKEQND
jgi:hypothetical protein